MNLIRPKVTSMYQNNDPFGDDAGDAPRFPVTATLRRMPINPMARGPNGNLRKIVPIRTPQSPAPPPPPPPPQPPSSSSTVSTTTTSPTSLMSLPHRVTVKKLSWEDDFNVFFWCIFHVIRRSNLFIFVVNRPADNWNRFIVLYIPIQLLFLLNISVTESHDEVV